MFAAVGNRVVALHRDRVGGLELLGDLEAGEFVAMDIVEAGAGVLERRFGISGSNGLNDLTR